MARINLGASMSKQGSPCLGGVATSVSIIDVPEHGTLPLTPRDVTAGLVGKKGVRGKINGRQVRVFALWDRGSGWFSWLLIWVRERGEWVGLLRRSWFEDSFGNDEEYIGPFQVDGSHHFMGRVPTEIFPCQQYLPLSFSPLAISSLSHAPCLTSLPTRPTPSSV